MKLHQHRFLTLLLGLPIIGLGGCAAFNTDKTPELDEMQMIALCKQDDQGITIESKIKAEYGFKRFAENTYRPVIERRLFGHKVHIIEFSDEGNKIYAAGDPLEFGDHFKWLLSNVMCAGSTCQAPLDNGQSLLIYKAKVKKSKNTTVIECTKAPSDD